MSWCSFFSKDVFLLFSAPTPFLASEQDHRLVAARVGKRGGLTVIGRQHTGQAPGGSLSGSTFLYMLALHPAGLCPSQVCVAVHQAHDGMCIVPVHNADRCWIEENVKTCDYRRTQGRAQQRFDRTNM